jgi:hypothetical protein
MNRENLQAEFPNFEQLVANEKLQYMYSFAKSSTIATILAPLLCIPLYLETTDNLLFNSWFLLMAIVVVARFFLIHAINFKGEVKKNFQLLNIALRLSDFCLGYRLVHICEHLRAHQLFGLSNHQPNCSICWHGWLLRQLEIIPVVRVTFKNSRTDFHYL